MKVAFLFSLIPFVLLQDIDDDDNDDECAFISGQHCDQNGICKYCAMCIQSSCVLSKANYCNTTQFGTTYLYDWYDYCLSSGNDSDGDYCATSTECYQYRKSAGPSVTYAWHNLTCNPSTCMLIASNGAPPPTPVPPLQPTNLPTADDHHQGSDSPNNTVGAPESPLQNPAAIALIVLSCLVIIAVLLWILHLCKKKHWWPFKQHSLTKSASVPSTAPPSFSSAPPGEIANQRIVGTTHQPSIRSDRSFNSTHTNELLPSYLSPYHSPPKYEQAIVTQIRGLRDEGSSSNSALDHHENPPSMWVPVYFTQPQAGGGGRRDTMQLFGFTPNYPMPSYFLHSSTSSQQATISNPFDDDQEMREESEEETRAS